MEKVKFSKGFVEFSVRTVIIVAIVVLLRIIIAVFLAETAFFSENLKIPDQFYLLTGVENGILFKTVLIVIVLFIMYKRVELTKIAYRKSPLKSQIVFAGLSMSALVLHYALKFYIASNIVYALQHTLFFAISKLLLNFVFVALLCLAVYGFNFTAGFIQKYYMAFFGLAVIGVVYFFIDLFFQRLWVYFSKFVALVVYMLLRLIYPNVTFMMGKNAPFIGVKDFNVAIGAPCSGIDSLLLFLTLFMFILAIDYKRLRKKRLALFFPIGLAGIYMMNILRVFLLLLVGIEYNAGFAIGLFHQNIGWILFLGYFAVFWYIISRYVYTSEVR